MDKELVTRLYASMLLIRRVEEHIADIYHTDAIKSPIHLSIGQESVAVGACDALQADDVLAHTYRSHATYLAKGGDLNAMMAELYGKIGGCGAGKAGSMHLIDMQHNVMGASAVVGTTIPVAAGYALALKWDKQKRIMLCFFGDGATEEGVFTETINFAMLHQLPIIFLCENNHLAIHSPLEKRWANPNITERMQSYGLSTYNIDDADVFTIRETVQQAAEHVRSGKGPTFVECTTYRWMEHVGPTDDHHESYRDKKALEKWKANDQIARLAEMLDPQTQSDIAAHIEGAIEAAVQYAEDSPYPDQRELLRHVYAA